MVFLSLNSISLRPGQWKAAQKRAQSAGASISEYVGRLIQRDLELAESFDQLLEPLREDFRRAGITEKKLDAIVRQARSAKPKRRPAKR